MPASAAAFARPAGLAAAIGSISSVKAGRHHDDTGQPLHSFRGLLEHMATLTRNTITLGQTTFDKLTLPTQTQHRAFELIGAPIPLTLK